MFLSQQIELNILSDIIACVCVCVCAWQALVGDRYGYRPFPRCIDAAEFETLMSVKGLTVSDVGTLTQWYQRDDNATSPCYLLQVYSNVINNNNVIKNDDDNNNNNNNNSQR